MFYKRRSTDFSFLDLPRALWYFLGPERWAFLFYSVVLLGCFCYVVVPPLIVGLMTNFLLGYTKTDAAQPRSLSPLFLYAGLLAASYAGVSLIRLIH
jgi:hypothetical protein